MLKEEEWCMDIYEMAFVLLKQLEKNPKHFIMINYYDISNILKNNKKTREIITKIKKFPHRGIEPLLSLISH